MSSAAERQTEQTVTNAEDALAALLTVGSELRLQVDVLIHTYGEHVEPDEKVPTTVIPTLNRLASRVDRLTEEITRLADEQQRQRTRLGVLGRRGFWFALIAVTVGVVLAAGTALYASQAVTRVEVARLAAEQARQAAEVDCPFYAVILGSYRPESRPEGDARRQYEEAFRVMRDIYENRIPCTGPLVPRAGG